MTPFPPGPDAAAGCPRAVFDRVQLLSRQHTVTVLCLTAAGEHLSRIWPPRVRVEAVPRRPAVPQGHLPQMAKRIRLGAGLGKRGRPALVKEFSSERLRRRLGQLLAAEPYDLVLVEHILMAQYLPGVPARLPVVISDHDVHLALGQADPRGHGPRAALVKYEATRWRRHAATAYRRAATVLVPTGEDAAWLSFRLPDVAPVVVPLGMPAQAGATKGPNVGHDRNAVARLPDTLLFVGNFAHSPNRDAAHWLVEEIVPALRRCRPNVRLWLVGADPTPDVVALAGPGITVTGRVPSVAPHLAACTVFVAPLRQGGGVRMKVLEALAAGAPVVTTTVGAAGIDVRPGVDVLVADTGEELASAIAQVLGDPTVRASLSALGRRNRSADRAERHSRLEDALVAATRVTRSPDR